MTSAIADTTAPSKQVYEKVTYDDSTNTFWKCPELGVVRENDSRLSVNGLLDKGDKEDFYKIVVQHDGPLQIVASADGPYRFQVMNTNGRVIADSLDGMGDATTNFKAMLNGTYAASASTLVLHVMRDPPGGSTTDVVNYTVKANMGTNQTDWVTWEKSPAADSASTAVTSPAVNLINSFLSDTASNSSSSGSIFDTLSNMMTSFANAVFSSSK